MRALFERSLSARAVAVVLAFSAVLALARAATAENDIGLRRDTLWPEPQPAVRFETVPDAVPVHRRHMRRIWAASRTRPLRITLARRDRRTRSAEARRAGRPHARVAGLRPPAEPQVIFSRLIVLPKPPRPALVSIFQDRTLRDGDAVMMADGIHVFHGWGEWPHLPRDFVKLTFAASLDWHFRQTLDVLDKNPPTRWSSMGSTAG